MTSHPDAVVNTAATENMADESEERALREQALLFDRSARGRVLVTGPRAAELLTGMVTNDVGELAPGHGAYACALTAKGRIIADLRIYAVADGLLIDCPERATEGWMAMVRKFINPRLAPYSDQSPSLRHFGVFGPRSADAIGSACGVEGDALRALAPYAHVSGEVEGQRVTIAQSPELRLEGFDLFVGAAAADPLRARLAQAGVGAGSPTTWDVSRVEAGRPEWGVDMDESTLPQEANMDELGAISYTKGCYVGQEVVARIHFRGHVNRHLRGLRFGHPDGAPRGTELFDAGGKPVGDVRSSVHSPRLGPIAIGMVRREIAVGDEVIARVPAGEIRAAVAPLPFPS